MPPLEATLTAPSTNTGHTPTPQELSKDLGLVLARVNTPRRTDQAPSHKGHPGTHHDVSSVPAPGTAPTLKAGPFKHPPARMHL